MDMLLIILLALFIWNFILTILVCKLYSKNKKVVCPQCGCAQIATIRQGKNDGYELVNICQNCGKSWNMYRKN